LPVDVDYGEDGTVQAFVQTNVSQAQTMASKIPTIPCWRVPGRGKYEREKLRREGLLTNLSVSVI